MSPRTVRISVVDPRLLLIAAMAAAADGGAAAIAQSASAPAVSPAFGARAHDVRGVTRAEAAATVSSEIVARIAAMPHKPGQSFKAGDVLVTFDCRRYEADLRAAEAEVKTHEIVVETNRQLLRHRATGANDLALAEAKLAQALASAESLRIRTRQCVIAAPYDGRVVEKVADIFEMPQANAPLLRIVKDGAMEVDLIVPSSWAVALRPDQEFSFRIEETGATYTAALQHLGAVVDPVSRTMKISARLVDPAPDVRPGMSGAARIGDQRSGADQ
jgi:RND family efflux transporter MFP subunit